MGTFSFREPPQVKGLPKSYSVSADGSPSYLTPTQLGRQELYKGVPFTAVFGLQRSVRDMSMAFAMSAAEMDAMDQTNLTDEERSNRMSRASLMILDELEFDANVVTMPLVFAVLIAGFSQFLVGYVFVVLVGRRRRYCFGLVVHHGVPKCRVREVDRLA